MRAVSDRDTALAQRYAAEIEQFKAFCERQAGTETFEEQDFYALSLGFFIALGITEDSSGDGEPEPFSDAFGPR